MTLIRLHNDDWGYETNCFACEPRNDRGLRVPFSHDTDRQLVTARFELGDEFSGAPTMAHGGIVLTLLDEAMAWACIAIGRQWALTTETTTRFRRPVHTHAPHCVEAWIVDPHGDDGAPTMTTAAKVINSDGEVCAEATATFTALGEAQVVRIAGQAVPGEHREYLRDG